MQQRRFKWVPDSNLPMVLGLPDNGLPIELLPFPSSHTCLADPLPQCSYRFAATQTVARIGTDTAIWYLTNIEGLTNYAYSQSATPIIRNPDPGPRTGSCPEKLLHPDSKTVANSSSSISKGIGWPC